HVNHQATSGCIFYRAPQRLISQETSSLLQEVRKNKELATSCFLLVSTLPSIPKYVLSPFQDRNDLFLIFLLHVSDPIYLWNIHPKVDLTLNPSNSFAPYIQRLVDSFVQACLIP